MAHIDVETILRPYPQCPVCNSDDRQRNQRRAKHISPYTRAMARAVGLAPEALLLRTTLWDCQRCGAVWHDPWLSTDFSDTLYGHICGTHFYGWLSVATWLEQAPTPVLAGRELLWKHLRRHYPGTLTYAELNCPHTGLVFAELEAEDRAENLRIAERKLLDLQRVYAASNLTERPSAMFIDRVKREAVEAERGFLVRRTLLTEDSPLCWRRSCIVRGASCHGFAQNFLFDRIVALASAEASGERFDLVGAFQTVDHMFQPTETMRRLLKVGVRVLLEMHAPGWTDLQHFYGLGRGFIDMFEEEGASVRDLTAVSRRHNLPVSSESLFFMLSLEDDLSWLPETSEPEPPG